MTGPSDETAARLGRLVAELVHRHHTLPPDAMEPFAAEVLGEHLSATEVVLLLQDYDQLAMFPVRAQGAGADLAVSLEGTVAGRAFTTSTTLAVPVPLPEGLAGPYAVRVWLPLLDGTDRLGVLGLVLPTEVEGQLDEDLRWLLERTASVLAELLNSKGQYTDAYFRARRRKDMGLAAEMQWSLLPPLTMITPRVAVAGVLEPAYDVGGDAFDYALDGEVLHVAIVDAMGHGTRASIMSTVALGAYRNARRRGEGLAESYLAVDVAVSEQFSEDHFCTMQLARVDLGAGTLELVNAGHPSPLLVRDRKVVRELTAPPTLPAGLGGAPPVAHVEQLQPGDLVVFYTDGLVEERAGSGEQFGLERLTDHVERVVGAGLTMPEAARRLSHELMAARGGVTSDDATLLLVGWPPTA